MKFNFFTDKPLEKYRKSDPLIMVFMLLLWGLGILALYFCSRNYALGLKGDSFYFVKRQLFCSLLGFIAFFMMVSMSMETIKKLLPLIVVGSLFLCLLTLIPFFGKEVNGARRWLKIPFLGTFQPSELIKFSLVLYLANYFDKMSKLKRSEKNVFPAVVFFIVFFSIVLIQGDFSTSLFLVGLGIIMFLIAGERIMWLIPFLIISIPFGMVMISSKEYRLNRLLGYIDKSGEFDKGINYQFVQAKKAIMSGGFWGQGFGSGLSKITSIPEVQTDYIFAGWVEATGFFGVLVYFILLGCFAWRVLKCSLTTSDRFSALTVFGFLLVIVGQSLINVAVVVGVLPTTGIPLPFFSSGGSSIFVTMAMCGFIVCASRLDNIGNSLYARSLSNDSIIGVGAQKNLKDF